MIPPARARIGACLVLLAALSSAAERDLPETLVRRIEASVQLGFDHVGRRLLPAGGFSGGMGRWVGPTAAMSIAYLSHGITEGHSSYGRHLTTCVDYLLALRRSDGLISTMENVAIYEHGMAILALAEAYGQFPRSDARIRQALIDGVRVIAACQNQRGGWRHRAATTDGDELASSVLQFMALRAVADLGITQVPASTIEDGLEYVKRSQKRLGGGGDGGFVYSYPGGESNYSRTAAGLACLIVGDDISYPGVDEGFSYLASFEPIGAQPVREANWIMFGGWFAVLAVHGVQARRHPRALDWGSYYPRMADYVISRQRADGGWGGEYDPFDTAAALIILSMHKRYLPVHHLR